MGSVQQVAAEKIYAGMGTSPDQMSKSGVIGISLGSGVIAGVAAATISQPADGLLSKVNKKGAGGEGSMAVRLGRIAAETGIVKLCTQGLFARWIHVGLITAGQFAVVDACMMLLAHHDFTSTTQTSTDQISSWLEVSACLCAVLSSFCNSVC